MTDQGASRSLRLMTQKSSIKGAPSLAPADSAAVTPGTISTSSSSPSCATSWRVKPAMPYTPGSPEETSETVWPSEASLIASLHLWTSRVIPDDTRTFPLVRSLIRLRYLEYPTMTSLCRIAASALFVRSSTAPGPIPTTYSFPLQPPLLLRLIFFSVLLIPSSSPQVSRWVPLHPAAQTASKQDLISEKRNASV